MKYTSIIEYFDNQEIFWVSSIKDIFNMIIKKGKESLCNKCDGGHGAFKGVVGTRNFDYEK